MSGITAFVIGTLYLGLIMAGSAAGTALVIGQSRTVYIAVVAGMCLIGGLAFATQYMH